MKTKVLLCSAFVLLFTGCSRTNQTWEDIKSAGRYLQHGFDSFCGKECESRLLASNDDFIGPYEEFIALNDHDLKRTADDMALPQPRGIPGENGVPSLDRFYLPDQTLGLDFVHFNTDEHVLRQGQDLEMVRRIAAYLKSHPGTYLLVEGHTDERASASYNMALGIRRASHIRQLLVKNGANLNQIYTVSYGKERPIALGHAGEDWKQNRRAEFKIFER